MIPKGGPQAQKHPADVIGNAVHVMRIATGEKLRPYRKALLEPAPAWHGRREFQTTRNFEAKPIL